MATKRYRIYKSGGETGKVVNLAAQFLAKAEMGMEQQQPSQQDQMMMVVEQIKNAIMQTAPVQEVLEFIIDNGLAEDVSSASDVYKQIKDELVTSGQMASQESEDVAMATEESDEMMMPEAQEGITMEERDADSATNDIPIGGRSEQLNKFVGTLKEKGNKAVAKEAMAAEGPVGTGALVAKDGLTLNERRTNRRIARFADQISPKYDFSDRKKIRRGLNKGEITMGDVFDESNMPSLENADNDLVQTIDPETGSRMFVRNRKGLLGKLKQDIYAENVPVSQLSMMFGPSSYASGIYGRSGTYGTTGSTYSTSGDRRSEIYYTKPTIIEAAHDLNDENIPEASEVNDPTVSTQGTSTKGTSTKKVSGSSGKSSSGSRRTKSKTTTNKNVNPTVNKVSQNLNQKQSDIEDSRFLNTLASRLIRQQVRAYNHEYGPSITGTGGALFLEELMIPEGVQSPLELNKPVREYLEGPNALSVDQVIALVGDQDIDLLSEYMSMYPTGSPEQIEIANAIAQKRNRDREMSEKKKVASQAVRNPNLDVYDKNSKWELTKAVAPYLISAMNPTLFSAAMSLFKQDGGYVDSTNPDLYKFTGGGDYFADGGIQLKDVTDPYMVKADNGVEMMSEQPNAGETMKDYFIRTGREDSLQYLSPEQQGQVYGEGEAGVASLNDPYANEQNQYGAFTDPNDPDALENSIQEQADVTRSITGTGQEDRNIDATKQEAEDLGYFGDDKMNFMSRYDAWKQGGKSQNIADGYTSENQVGEDYISGVYDTGKGRRGRRGLGLFPFINSIAGGNRIINRNDAAGYYGVKGLQRDAEGNFLPLDPNKISEIKRRTSLSPRGRFRDKVKIKFGEGEAGSPAAPKADDKPGFFDRVKERAGSMVQGFKDRKQDKTSPGSNEPVQPYQEKGPTYQQQIEGDGEEYGEMIMNDARVAGAIKDEPAKPAPAPKASQSDIDQMLEQDRMFNQGEMLDNSRQQTFRPTTRSASGQTSPNPNSTVTPKPASETFSPNPRFMSEMEDKLERDAMMGYAYGGANNVMQFANTGAVTDFSIIDPNSPSVPQPDGAVNNEGLVGINSSLADNMMSFNPAMPENPYGDSDNTIAIEPENLEDCTEEQKRDTTSKCYDPKVAQEYQSGTIKAKYITPTDINVAGAADIGFGAMDITANLFEGLNDASKQRQATTKAMNPDDNYEQVQKRGTESDRTRLQIGDSNAKFEMIKGQNRSKYGGPIKEGEVYDLSMDQIKEIIANGGKIEFI